MRQLYMYTQQQHAYAHAVRGPDAGVSISGIDRRTLEVEHLSQGRALWPDLRRMRCCVMTSACTFSPVPLRTLKTPHPQTRQRMQ